MIGKNLKMIREANNKTVYEIEQDLKINHTSIYRWEQNKNLPNIEQCIKLADYYCISIDELVGHEIKKNW